MYIQETADGRGQDENDCTCRQHSGRRLGGTGVQAVYTGHCTGQRPLEILQEELGDKVHTLMTGLVFEIE